jgi:hypothetical protein
MRRNIQTAFHDPDSILNRRRTIEQTAADLDLL